MDHTWFSLPGGPLLELPAAVEPGDHPRVAAYLEGALRVRPGAVAFPTHELDLRVENPLDEVAEAECSVQAPERAVLEVHLTCRRAEGAITGKDGQTG